MLITTHDERKGAKGLHVIALIAAFILASNLFETAACFGAGLFWADVQAGKIQASNADGSDAMDVISSTPSPWGIAIDASHGHVYWTEHAPSTQAVIMRSDLDGANVITVLSKPAGAGNLQFAQFMALDPANGDIYYTEGNSRTLRRTNYDGTVDETVLRADLNGPVGLALDLDNGQIYWSHIRSTRSKLMRSNLDGTETVELLDQQGFFYDVEVDVANGHVYWADQHPNFNAIRRADLDGSNSLSIVSIPGMKPSGLELDLDAGKMYWSLRGGEPGIMRANFDGSNVETVISQRTVPGLDYTIDVALIPEPSTFTLATLGLLGILGFGQWKRQRLL